MLVLRHEFEDAVAEVQAAARTNPLDLGLQTSVGQFLLFAKRLDEAVAQLEYTVDIGSHFWPARCLLAQTHALLGDGAAAKRQLERGSGDIPVASFHQPEAFIHAVLGDQDEARAQLARREASQSPGYVAPCEIARGYAALGEADTAFDWIDAAIDEGAPMVLGIDTFPGFERIRNDGRFARRLARIGLPT